GFGIAAINVSPAAAGAVRIDGFKIVGEIDGIDDPGADLVVQNNVITAGTPGSGTGVDATGANSAIIQGNLIENFAIGVNAASVRGATTNQDNHTPSTSSGRAH